MAGQRNVAAGFGDWCARRAIWVIGFWVLLAGVLNVFVPQVEVTVAKNSAPFISNDLPAVNALREMADDFDVPHSTAIASLVIESEHRIGPAEQDYYRQVVDRLNADREDVAYLIDVYGNPAIGEVGQSPDGKAIVLTVAGVGDVGSARAHESTVAIRAAIDSIPKPEGLQTHLTGAGPTLADLFTSMDQSLLIITAVSVVLITILLLIAFKSWAAAAIPLVTIGICLGVARPIVSLLGLTHVIPVSNLSIAIATAMVLGGATDYAIFTVTSFFEGRRRSVPWREAIGYSSARVTRIIVASALTVAVASAAMAFCKSGIFRTAGIPTAISIVVAGLVALTVPPALLRLLAPRGWLEPRPLNERRWRRIGSRVVRSAIPLSVAAVVLLLAASSVLLTAVSSFDEDRMQIRATDSTDGLDAVYRHWPVNEAMPEFLLVRADHDMRNTNDLAALEAVAIGVANVPQVAHVRSITRPDGAPIPEASVGYQTGRVADGLADADRQLQTASPQLRALAAGVDRLNAGAADAVRRLPELASGTQRVVTLARSVLDGLDVAEGIVDTATAGSADLRQATDRLTDTVSALSALAAAVGAADEQQSAAAARIADAFRPFLADAPSPACAADPRCLQARQAFTDLNAYTAGAVSAALRQAGSLTGYPRDVLTRAQTALPQIETGLAGLQRMLDQLDGQSPDAARAQLVRLSDGVNRLTGGLADLSSGLGQVKAGTDQTVALTAELQGGLRTATDYLSGLSSHTTVGPGSGFYLPPEGLAQSRFVDGAKLLMSPDGRTARMLVVWNVNPFSDEALNTASALAPAAAEAAEGTVLDGARFAATGYSSIADQMRTQVFEDFALFGTVAVIGVFLVLAVLLRSLVAPAFMVATVVLSFAAAGGVSVFVWQHLLGIPLDWSVLPVSFMALVAVGADYSMLFADRIREEAERDGMVRGILRGFTSTGSVITTAGLVFAITMFALMSGSVFNLVQIGSTVGLGLLLDIAVVRTIFIPAGMVIIGDRMWWPRMPAAS